MSDYKPAELTVGDLELARSVGIIYKRSMAHITKACLALELSYSEFVVLIHLYGQFSFRQDELAALLDIDKAAITRTVNTLEAKELVQRITDKNDRRVKRISLTDSGLKLKEPVTAIISEWSKLLWADLPAELRRPFREAVCSMAVKASREQGMLAPREEE